MTNQYMPIYSTEVAQHTYTEKADCLIKAVHANRRGRERHELGTNH